MRQDKKKNKQRGRKKKHDAKANKERMRTKIVPGT
jgi:hypothetical protein